MNYESDLCIATCGSRETEMYLGGGVMNHAELDEMTLVRDHGLLTIR